MVEFKLPDVGEGMHEGEISKWLVKEGQTVVSDQPVVEVQTDKVNAELTSPVTGIVQKIFFAEGDTVEVGTTLFIIEDQSEVEAVAAVEIVMDRETQTKSLTESKRSVETVADKRDATVPLRALATPYVRQMAREMKIDLDRVKGTGPAGRVSEEDLQRFGMSKQADSTVVSPDHQETVVTPTNASPTQAPVIGVALEERIPLKGIRKKIAEHMIKSVRIIPHVTHVDELEMDSVKALRDRMKGYAEEKGVKLTFLPFFIKAIVIALKEFKTLNASIDDESNEIVLRNYYHIGIATDTKDGLVVPVIKNADQKTLFELADEINHLAIRAREGKLTLDQITGSTFTISNVGPIGGLHATPIINHPEVAILALHKMEPRMVVRDWEGVIRLMMNMSLSFDHRLIDGVTAVHFTNRIKQLLENPDLLFMELR